MPGTVVGLLLLLVVGGTRAQTPDCDVFDPACRARLRAAGSAPRFLRQRVSSPSTCNYRDLWLIPGRADASCTRPGAKRVLDIDPQQVQIKPDVVRLPGCFTVEIKNVRVLDNRDAIGNSFFTKAEYQWWNVREFGQLKCQNASANGCGGYGNNCYFCDVCESLTELDESRVRSSLADQFRGISCPRRPGFYTFRKEFCFNDWSAFDSDGDCRFDFIQGDRFEDYRSAFTSLQQIGYGTVVAKIRLAFNATGTIAEKRANKEAQIEESVQRELDERRRNWDVNNGQFDKFRQWYIDYRKNLWHKEEYLPWLLYENEISCLRVTFDVCERPPRNQASFGDGGGSHYTCDSA